MKLSLVIPARNEEDQIAGCLRSALAQRLPFYEIIVVDNDSTDRTAAIAASFPGVTIVSEAHQGIVYARNKGFDTASGAIIARIDADTRLPADWSQHIATFYAGNAHHDTAWTCSGRFTDVPLPRFVQAGYSLVTVRINRWLTGYPALWGSSTALPAKLWQTVRQDICLDTGFHEDLDLTTHLHQAGFRIRWDRSMVVTAQLRHAYASARELWEYLQWWPRTLRRHGNKLWPLCWLGGSLLMFAATWLFIHTQTVYQWSTSKRRPAQLPTSLEV